MSQLRHDPLTKKWTIISPERSRRTDAFTGIKKTDALCPFCNGGTSLYEIYKIDGKNGTELKVVPNKYPVLGIEGLLERSGFGLYDNITGIGANEIIIDSPRHGLKVGDYTEQELFNLFKAFKARMDDLSKDVRFRYLQGFKSIGFEAGQSIDHPHSQIVALPVIPANVEIKLRESAAYYLEKERCLSCDIISSELESRKRIVFENYDFVAFCPYASAYPFATSIYPKKHNCSFPSTSEGLLKQLAEITKEVYLRISLLLKSPAVMTAIITAPPKDGRTDIKNQLTNIEQAFHWHLEIRPVITAATCLEWAAGVTVNPVEPEEAALHLREAAVK